MERNGQHIERPEELLRRLAATLQLVTKFLQEQAKRNGMPELLTIEDVAQLTKFHKRTINRMVCNGEIPKPKRVGKSPRWLSTNIIQWMLNGCPKDNNE